MCGVCCTNLIGYALWLVLVVVLGAGTKSTGWRSRIPWSLPANVFIFFPILFAFCSLALCVKGIFLEFGDRRFGALANGVMLVLWMSVVIAPH
jgi:hypothetical protein